MLKIIIKSVSALENNFRLDKWLHHRELQIPFSHIQKLCRSGQVRVNKKRAKSSYRLKAGDIIRFPVFQEKTSLENNFSSYSSNDKIVVDQLVEELLFQDDNYIILNKPPGLPVQGGSKVKTHLTMLFPLIAKKLSIAGKTLYLPHRLDKETSGLIIIAKTSLACREISEAFKKKQIYKKYLALCEETPTLSSGKIESYLSKDKKNKHKRIMLCSNKKGKYALTFYKCLKKNKSQSSLLELNPITGRSHQLRVACQSIGCAIMGDTTYNKNPSKNIKNLMLHSWQIIWPAQKWNFIAPLPGHFIEQAKEEGFEMSSRLLQNLKKS